MKKQKKRKLTVRQRFDAARAKREAARIAAHAAEEEYEATVSNLIFGDSEKLIRAHSVDPSLSPEKRLEILKSTKGWPRYVLGFYEAERAIAEQNPDEEPGKPSDIAYEKVGKFIGVGEDRVKALCNEGRQQIKDGLSAKLAPPRSIAEFKKLLHGLSTK